MDLTERSWLGSLYERLDPALREALGAGNQVAGRGGRLREWALAWRRRFQHLPVLVELDDCCGEEECRDLCRFLGSCGGRDVRSFEVVRAVAARVPLGAVPRVAERPGVRRVLLDRPVRALLDVATPTVRAPRAWQAGARGSGVTVAVLDTGIHPHRDFLEPAPRLVAFFDAVRGRRDFYDDNGHGTHVAGIVAGSGVSSGGRYAGIAPAAGLVGIKVLDRYGFGRMSTVLAGIEWAVRNRDRYGIRVLNISLGAPAFSSYRDDPLARAAGAAWEAGIVVCAAAGNEGPEAGTINTPGIHPDVITVGAADDRKTPERDDDVPAAFSSRGPAVDGILKPDVMAPGVGITSTSSPNSLLARQLRTGAAPYLTLSGTSMATPVVSGLAALLLSRHPELTPGRVKALLMQTAADLGADPSVQGRGLVDGFEALSAAGAALGPARGVM